jgi:peptidoglycan-associated lipoprotein
MKKLGYVALLGGLAAGCSTTPDATTAQGGPGQGAAAPVTSATVATVQAAQPSGRVASEQTDPNNILSKRSVYFEYDHYTVAGKYQELLAAHSKYLAKHPEAKVLLQGNADERGSTEYNLALGQKRAEAVRATLRSLGVSDKQIEAVSLGEEKPRATGHDEKAWAENRRADILYPGEY